MRTSEEITNVKMGASSKITICWGGDSPSRRVTGTSGGQVKFKEMKACPGYRDGDSL